MITAPFKQISRIFILFFAVLLMAGCATKPIKGFEDVQIEHVNSDVAQIIQSNLRKGKKGIELYGEIERIRHTHGFIPGNLLVSIYSANGELQKQANVGYTREGSKSVRATFYVILPFAPESGSTIRITHLSNKDLHPEDAIVWRDSES